MPKEQRTFTKEFKVEAVRLANTSGKPITEIARDLGVSDSTIHNWRKQLAEQREQAFPGSGHQTAKAGRATPTQTRAGSGQTRTRYFKKSHHCLLATPAMKFHFLAENAQEYPVKRLCQVLGINESAYYKWRKRPPSARHLQDEILAEQMKAGL
jgi:transposase